MALDMLADLEAFATVARKRSFVVAARGLGRSPSSLTRAIQGLEERSGVKLFNRSANAVTLTEAGERLLPHAYRMLDLQREADEDLAGLSGLATGWIRFSAPQSFAHTVIPGLIAQYSQRYPDVSVDVIFTDAAVDPVKGKLDFSIRGAFPQSSDLIGYPLWSYSRYLYASPGYLERCVLAGFHRGAGTARIDPAHGTADSQGMEFSWAGPGRQLSRAPQVSLQFRRGGVPGCAGRCRDCPPGRLAGGAGSGGKGRLARVFPEVQADLQHR